MHWIMNILRGAKQKNKNKKNRKKEKRKKKKKNRKKEKKKKKKKMMMKKRTNKQRTIKKRTTRRTRKTTTKKKVLVEEWNEKTKSWTALHTIWEKGEAGQRVQIGKYHLIFAISLWRCIRPMTFDPKSKNPVVLQEFVIIYLPREIRDREQPHRLRNVSNQGDICLVYVTTTNDAVRLSTYLLIRLLPT